MCLLESLFQVLRGPWRLEGFTEEILGTVNWSTCLRLAAFFDIFLHIVEGHHYPAFVVDIESKIHVGQPLDEGLDHATVAVHHPSVRAGRKGAQVDGMVSNAEAAKARPRLLDEVGGVASKHSGWDAPEWLQIVVNLVKYVEDR
jgi:hypothetical protein